MSTHLTQQPSSVRKRILAAAELVLMENGAATFTLDAVAQRSGVSKGGLLYHFPSKDSLILALAQRYAERLQPCSRDTSPRRRDAYVVGDHIRELVLAALSDESSSRTLGSILRVAASNAESLLVIKQHIASCVPPFLSPQSKSARMAVILLAIEGMMIRESLQISPFTDEQRVWVLEELLRLSTA